MVKYWWVNQKRTFIEDVKERNPGIVAAVTTISNGSRVPHHERVKEMHPDDRIISNVDAKIVAIGRVISKQNIDEEHYWQVSNAVGEAYQVEVIYQILDTPIMSKIFREKIADLKIPDGPIMWDKNGNPYHRTGYVFCFSKKGLDVIRDSQPVKNWPDWA
jgi:hypothetical protein